MARLFGAVLLVALGVILLAAASVSGQASCQPPTSSVVRRWPAGPSVLHTIDPWIVPSVNTTNGSLPPGVCPFSAYPVINATCRDFIKFVGRAIPAGLRVHGVYLLEDDFVNQATGAHRCPSTATDLDLRNGTNGGYANPGRCRGKSITQVLIDGTTNWTQPFVAGEDCSGYIELDELEVVSFKNAAGNCSTASVIATDCLEADVYVANLSKLVKKGTSKTLVFSCPNISGNQPGGAISHCHVGMTLVVNVKC